MARGGREDKLRKRAREELTAALRRDDVERAVAAVLALPAADREAELPAVARLFRGALNRARRDGDRARLEFWAARAEREPGLVTAGATADEVAEARWCLYWAAVRAKHWDRARGHLPAFAGRLSERLRLALLAYVDDAGAPPPERLQPFAAAARADPRLGYDGGTPRPAPAAPRAAAEVEAAVLALAGVRGVREFVATIEKWEDSAPELSGPILGVAVKLLPRWILERVRPDGGCDGALEPAAALARFARRLGVPGELGPELGLALRIAGGVARAHPDGIGRDRAEEFFDVIEAAARLAPLRPAAMALAVSTPYPAEALGSALVVFAMLANGPDAGTVSLKVLSLWPLRGELEGRPPEFVIRGIEELLDRPGALAGVLAALPVPTRQGVLAAVPRSLPLELAERFLDEAWGCEEAIPREAWLDALDALLLEARMSAARGVPVERIEEMMVMEAVMASGVVPGPEQLGELRRILRSPEGRRTARQLEAMEAESEGRPLPPAGKRIWARFAARALPFGLPYLELALEQGARKPERIRIVSIYLGEERRRVPDVVEALAGAEREEFPRSAKALVEYLLEGSKGKRELAAQALVYARRRGLRRGICGPLARAFEAEDGRIGEAADDSEAVRDARLEVRLLGRRGRKPAAARGPAGNKSAGAAGARRPTGKRRPAQVTLPFGGKGNGS
jgi:hypothetical protein